MKKILALSISLNCLLLVGLYSGLSGAHAAPQSIPIGNGDVNADGAYDITDAVYLLTWMFLDGPAPLPFEGGSPAGGILPATGQSRCFDPDGSEVACSSTVCGGQDGAYQAGCPRAGRFVDNGDGTVTDSCTGLMWQQATGDIDGDGRTGPGDFTTWCGALDYCEGLTLAGHDDWRLPNVVELVSLVDYGRNRPAIDPLFETAAENPCYHTSNFLRGGPAPGEYGVDFSIGLMLGGGGLPCYARAVRNAGSPVRP